MNKSKEVQNLKDKLKRRENKIDILKEKNRQLEEKVRKLESANKKKRRSERWRATNKNGCCQSY
jgi:hypothetical protein